MEYGRSGTASRIKPRLGKLAAFGTRLATPRLVMFTAFAAMSLVNYGFGLAAGWLLAPGDFGLLAFAQTLLTLSGLVLSSGFAWSLAAGLVNSNNSRRAELVRGALLANLLLAVGLGILFCGLFAVGPLKAGLESWTVTGLVVTTLPLVSFIAIVRATAQGYERFRAFASLWVIETVVKAILGIGLVLAGFGAAGAVTGFFGGAFITTVICLGYLLRVLKIPLFGVVQKPKVQLAGAMFAALLGMALLLNLDLLSLKLFSTGDRAAVGRYQAASMLANMPYYFLTATIPILFTQIARLKGLARSVPIVSEAFRLALVVLLPIEAVMAVFPELALRSLFPLSYLAGASVLRILALGNMAVILVAVLSTTYQASGYPGIPGRLILGVTIIELLVQRVIIPRWQGQGAALVFLTTAGVLLVILGQRYLTKLDNNSIFKAWSWLKRYAIAVIGGMMLGGAALLLGHSSLAAILVGGFCYIAGVARWRLFSIFDFIRETVDSRPDLNVKDG